jgi:hypothetical protein
VDVPPRLSRLLGIPGKVFASTLASHLEKLSADYPDWFIYTASASSLARVKPESTDSSWNLREIEHPFQYDHSGEPDDTETGGGSPKPYEDKADTDSRKVNLWIEDGDLPLVQAQSYIFGFNIGGSRDNALVSEDIPDVDWGNRQSLELLVVLSGRGFSIDPPSKTITLQKQGDTVPFLFKLSPTEAGFLYLRIGLYLARELTLLEEYEIPFEVMAAVPVVESELL